MSAKTLLTLLNKGGVGKTSLVRNLGAELARRGYTVVLVDTDPQGSLTQTLGLNPEPSFYNWIARGSSFSDAIRTVATDVYALEDEDPAGWLGVIPSNWESANVHQTPDVAPIVVRQQIDKARQNFAIDLFILDPPPSESGIHPWLIYASDYALLPTHATDESFSSLRNTVQYLHNHQALRTGLGFKPTQIIGIQPMQVQPRGLIIQQEFLNLIREAFGDTVWPPIHERRDWQEAVAFRQSVVSRAPHSEAAREFTGLVNRVIAATQLAPVGR